MSVWQHKDYVVYDRVFEEMEKCVDDLMEVYYCTDCTIG